MTEAMGHCTPEILEGYYAGTLPEAVLAEVLAHFAKCAQCLARAKRIGDGLTFMETWAAETRQEAERTERLEEALSRAESRAGLVFQRDRIRRWRHRVAEGGTHSRRERVQWRYAFLNTRREGQVLGEQAIRTRSKGREQTSSQWVVGEVTSRITVSSAQPVLIGLDQAQAGGLVALVPESGGRETQLAEIRDSTIAEPRWIARFESVAPGEYSVVFEQ